MIQVEQDVERQYKRDINKLYCEILRRPADKMGLQHYVTLLEKKLMTIEDVRKSISESEEGRTMLEDNRFVEDEVAQEKFLKYINPELKSRFTTASCNICGNSGTPFLVKRRKLTDQDQKENNKNWPKSPAGDDGLSETLACKSCRSISRDRMLIWNLAKALDRKGPLEEWKEDKSIRILDSSAQRSYPIFLDEKFDYFNTYYNPEKIKAGEEKKQYADFQNLHYEDEFFEIVLSSMVFEHIRLHVKAFKEVYRVLRKGGKFLLQIPYNHGWDKTLIKVEPQGDKDIFLTEPEYHEGHTLVYRIYGRDLLDLLGEIGFSVEYISTQMPEFMIPLQQIIICTK